MMLKRIPLSLVFTLVAVFVFTGIASSAKERPVTVAELALYNGADRQQILEEGAKKEGKLTLYTTEILTESVRPKIVAFQKKYPHINLKSWRVNEFPLLPRILEEYKAGAHTVDIIEAPQLSMSILQKEGIIQPFYSPNLVYIQERSISKAHGEGVFYVAYREHGVGLGYNTKLIAKDALPKTYLDLLNPKWKDKGKVVIASGAGPSDSGSAVNTC